MWEREISPQEWQELFSMAQKHQILPMIYGAVYQCPSAQEADPQIFAPYKRMVMRLVTMQMVQTNESLKLYQFLSARGIQPIVVKGMICRELYPNPDERMSGDEDFLIRPEQFEECHLAMLAYGMCLSDPEMDIWSAYEVPYGKKGSPLYIELHKYLFPPDSDAYGELNVFFEEIFEKTEVIQVQGCEILGMNATDHLFYLICHAFKHFLHSGFGIRQVCDIVLFANAYGHEIDWSRLLASCQKIHADLFVAALFQIGEKYLTFDPETACYPPEWRRITVDETAMLDDLLDGGVYGDSDLSRKHSSTITLNAVTADRKGQKTKVSVWKSVFPPAKDLEGRYPYLRKHGYLLPIAWINRILHYRKETREDQGDDAVSAIQIGSHRIELMKKYGIIK